MKEETRQILEIVTKIQEEMATKADLESVRAELKGELEGVRKDLQQQIIGNTEAIDRLTEQMKDVRGYSKEIDSLIDRVAVLEKNAK